MVIATSCIPLTREVRPAAGIDLDVLFLFHFLDAEKSTDKLPTSQSKSAR